MYNLNDIQTLKKKYLDYGEWLKEKSFVECKPCIWTNLYSIPSLPFTNYVILAKSQCPHL